MRGLKRLESWLHHYGKSVYPVYALCLFALGIALLLHFREPLAAGVAAFSPFEVFLLCLLCGGILMLGFPSSRLGYVSFDRITQAGLIWLVGAPVSALFNALASFIFPFHIRRQLGYSPTQALIRAFHNAGMIILIILTGGAAFVMAGGEHPVEGLHAGLFLPVAATILGMQLANGLLVRIRFALTDGRLRVPVDWFANFLETAAALMGLLTALIVVNTDRGITAAYLVVLLTLIYAVKRLNDSRQQLEHKVMERTAHIEAQNRQLEEAHRRQQKLVEALDRLSREDALTSLHNRRHLDECLEQERERVTRYGGQLSIAFLDLDHFKAINDRHSHQVGDEVLCVVADILRETARSTDIVGRYGGEEFLIILPNTDLKGAKMVVERCREALEVHDWSLVHPEVRITASGGVAELDPERDDLEALLRRADERLYTAKRRGRNRVLSHER